MQRRAGWSREQLLIAFHLYCQMPFGKMHRGNADIIRFATLIGRTPSALAMKLTNIASLDPAITGTGRKGLDGASKADQEMWDEMQKDWVHFVLEAQHALDRLEGRASNDNIADAALLTESDNYDGEEKVVATKVRVGQSFFRRAVLSAYEYRCCISGLTVPQFLIASHIVPWRTDAKNRLNPHNGLCLSVLHDRAFDSGLISITDDMTIQISPKMKAYDDAFLQESISKFRGRPIHMPEKFLPSKDFLAFHRKTIFQGEAE